MSRTNRSRRRAGRRLHADPPEVAPGPRRGTAGDAASPVKTSRTGGTPATGPDTERLEGFDRAIRFLVVGTGVLAWMTAGFLVLFAMSLTPDERLGGVASMLKAATLIGWVVIGAGVLRDAYALRRRAFYLGLAAWAWVFALAWLVGQIAAMGSSKGI
jgi:hypothetical protein